MYEKKFFKVTVTHLYIDTITVTKTSMLECYTDHRSKQCGQLFPRAAKQSSVTIHSGGSRQKL